MERVSSLISISMLRLNWKGGAKWGVRAVCRHFLPESQINTISFSPGWRRWRRQRGGKSQFNVLTPLRSSGARWAHRARRPANRNGQNQRWPINSRKVHEAQRRRQFFQKINLSDWQGAERGVEKNYREGISSWMTRLALLLNWSGFCVNAVPPTSRGFKTFIPLPKRTSCPQVYQGLLAPNSFVKLKAVSSVCRGGFWGLCWWAEWPSGSGLLTIRCPGWDQDQWIIHQRQRNCVSSGRRPIRVTAFQWI